MYTIGPINYGPPVIKLWEHVREVLRVWFSWEPSFHAPRQYHSPTEK